MILNKSTTKISGPPGTGKTTYLLGVVDDLLKKGTDPSRIAYVTFTRAGANEAKTRAMEKFGLDEDKFTWFRTLHSLCYKAIGAGRKERVMTGKHLCEVGRALGLMFTLKRQVNDGQFINNTKGDHILAIHNLHRLRRTSLADEAKRYTGAIVSHPEMVQFDEYYCKYKAENRLIDFSDLLYRFVTGAYNVDVDYIIVDEAQDLSKLQWMVVQKMAKQAKQVWVAGDDDQAIFVWGGADPEILIELKGNHEVLSQSYRVPKTVHKLALSLSERISKRLDKKYGPRDFGGRAEHIHHLDSIEISPSSSWLFLARNRKFLQIYQKFLFTQGCAFESPFDDDDLRSARQAVHAWVRLTGGELISAAEAKVIYNHLPVREAVKYGFKKKLSFIDDDEALSLDQMRKDYGLVRSGPWEDTFKLNDEVMAYIKAMESNGGLSNECNIEINTIHGSKGKEADNIVLDLNMTERTHQGYLDEPDNEHRVFYVGATRAKENLYILSPKEGKHYDL